MIETITDQHDTLAIIVRSGYSKDGIEFFTPNDFSQQLAYMKRPKNHRIQPHKHNFVPRKVNYTQEVLLIKSGKVRVDFFDRNESYLQSRILEPGDVILFAGGGHGFIMLEETEIIEVKQGPYAGDHDKTRFEGIPEKHIEIKREN